MIQRRSARTVPPGRIPPRRPLGAGLALLGALLLALLGSGCTALAEPPLLEAGPPAFEFRLGPGDRVQVDVWGETKLRQELVLGPDGVVSFPLIGDLNLSGKTLDEARVELAQRLRAGYVDPVVSVALLEMRSHVLHVLGEVARPGTIPYVRGATVLAAILAAGGHLDATAELSEVRVIRARTGTPIAYGLDLEAVLRGERSDMWLVPGDSVYVPPRALARWDRFWDQLWPW